MFFLLSTKQSITDDSVSQYHAALRVAWKMGSCDPGHAHFGVVSLVCQIAWTCRDPST